MMAGISPVANSDSAQQQVAAREAAPSTLSSATAFARELAREAAAARGPSRTPSTVVDKVATPLTGSQAAAALQTAWQSTFHETPRPEQLSVLVAQWSHETGGGRGMMNYNFGGIKGTGPSGLTAAYRTTEGYGETERKITDHFRAYHGAREGATDYVRFLKDHFPKALDAARSGDATGFVQALKNGGYFTASLEDYSRSVSQLTAQARSQGYDAVGKASVPGAVGVDARPVAGAGSLTFPVGGIPSALANLGSIGEGLSFPNNPDANSPAAALSAVDALSMADELSRAALRIAANNGDDR